MTYLGQKQAYDLDVELMNVFSTDQLMELAGLSVAAAVHQHYAQRRPNRTIVLCGPGNNGGDGLVAARHLSLFGFPDVQIVYPKKTEKPLMLALMRQAEMCGIPITNQWEVPKITAETDFTVVVDAIFGYSFTGDIREPFATILREINSWRRLYTAQVETVSVDVPSGWNVEGGRTSADIGLDEPNVLVSLMLPKLGVRSYSGRHYLGGRFVPQSFAAKHNLNIPPFPGNEQFVEISPDFPGHSSSM